MGLPEGRVVGAGAEGRWRKRKQATNPPAHILGGYKATKSDRKSKMEGRRRLMSQTLMSAVNQGQEAGEQWPEG